MKTISGAGQDKEERSDVSHLIPNPGNQAPSTARAPTPTARARPREPVSGPRIPGTPESQDWSDLADVLALT